jgi:hypothetical protein
MKQQPLTDAAHTASFGRRCLAVLTLALAACAPSSEGDEGSSDSADALQAAESAAPARSVLFGTSVSDKLLRDSIANKLFGRGDAIEKLDGTRFRLMDKTLTLKANAVSNAAVDLKMNGDIAMRADHGCELACLVRWDLYLNDLKMQMRLRASDFDANVVDYRDGDTVVPALKLTLKSSSFTQVQHGWLHIDYRLWDENHHFKGIFKGFEWTALYRIRKTGAPGQARIVLTPIQGTSQFALGSRTFVGDSSMSAKNRAKFLKSYGDNIEKQYDSLGDLQACHEMTDVCAHDRLRGDAPLGGCAG